MADEDTTMTLYEWGFANGWDVDQLRDAQFVFRANKLHFTLNTSTAPWVCVVGVDE